MTNSPNNLHMAVVIGLVAFILGTLMIEMEHGVPRFVVFCAAMIWVFFAPVIFFKKGS